MTDPFFKDLILNTLKIIMFILLIFFVQAKCQWYEEFICNSTRKNLEAAEVILKKCELKCCEVDECNLPEDKESRNTVSMKTASVFITFIGVVMFMLEFFNY